MDKGFPLLRTGRFVLYQQEKQGKTCVMKVFEENSFEAFREIETHRSASKLTSGVLRFLGEVVVDGKVGFEMEQCTLSLKTLCDKYRAERQEWSEADVIDIGISMIEVLQRLHSAWLVHNRISEESWQLTDDSPHKLRLSDFSEAKFVRKWEGQAAQASDEFSQDVRGLGCVLYYLALGKVAKYTENFPRDLMEGDIKRKFKQLHYSPSFPELLLRMFWRTISLSECLSALEAISQSLP